MKRFTLFIVAALMTVVGATAQSKAKLQEKFEALL